MSDTAFFPQLIYAPVESNQVVPRVLVAPPRYVQGPGTLQSAGRYMSVMNVRKVGVLASARGHRTQAAELIHSLKAQQIAAVPATFTGECSIPAIDAAVAELRAAEVDCVVALGGGKCVDAGKCVAHRLDVPVVIVPTLASNDAPCSALSVLYTPEGVAVGAEFFPQNPSLVIVDTQVVAQASERYLVAGMGDAMATWYEAKVCLENPSARNAVGARPTLASCALGETCATTLYADGLAAAEAVRSNGIDDALERVVEANTLLSGIGFESGGLAAAHGLAQGYTTLPAVESNYLHGEMVAMGVVTQLMMQDDPAEARRVTEFFAAVGLPVSLGQVGLSASEAQAIASVAEGAMAFEPIHNLPFEVSADVVRNGMLAADVIGREVISSQGDDAYRRVQQ